MPLDPVLLEATPRGHDLCLCYLFAVAWVSPAQPGKPRPALWLLPGPLLALIPGMDTSFGSTSTVRNTSLWGGSEI